MAWGVPALSQQEPRDLHSEEHCPRGILPMTHGNGGSQGTVQCPRGYIMMTVRLALN